MEQLSDQIRFSVLCVLLCFLGAKQPFWFYHLSLSYGAHSIGQRQQELQLLDVFESRKFVYWSQITCINLLRLVLKKMSK